MNRDDLKHLHLPSYRELPPIGLYLEQAVRYINGFLMPLGFTELTTSMVSNYVKLGLIAPPVKKQYNAEQLAYLFFIAVAKNVVSMENIKTLLRMQQATYPTPIAYDYFCDELKNMLFYTFGLKDTVDEIGTRNSEEKTIFRSIIIAVSHIIYVQHQLDEYK